MNKQIKLCKQRK